MLEGCLATLMACHMRDFQHCSITSTKLKAGKAKRWCRGRPVPSHAGQCESSRGKLGTASEYRVALCTRTGSRSPRIYMVPHSRRCQASGSTDIQELPTLIVTDANSHQHRKPGISFLRGLYKWYMAAIISATFFSFDTF